LHLCTTGSNLFKRFRFCQPDQMVIENENYGMSTSFTPVNGGQRRSPRIALLISINVAGQDLQKCAFSDAATATNLNLHGATIHVNRQLIVGSVIAVTNHDGIEASARIVAQVGVAEGAFIYGIEFVHGRQPNFLGVSFYASASQESKTCPTRAAAVSSF
jgi:hypothetical protein